MGFVQKEVPLAASLSPVQTIALVSAANAAGFIDVAAGVGLIPYGGDTECRETLR
jgi:hypothetical protein